MAYIDSELAKRLHPASVAAQSRTSQPPHHVAAAAAPSPQAPAALQRQPATLGKLQEIDLGAEAHERNVQRTEAARRLLSGGAVEDGAAEPKRPRLGRDGKPMRGRKRRNSDDVRRDRLVEEVLRENALEHYEAVPVSRVDAGMVGRDEEADDRLAEAFRREFLDAVEERQRKKPVQQVGTAGRAGQGKKDEEVLKGPKLGGSRSARAAMREVLLKAERGKK